MDAVSESRHSPRSLAIDILIVFAISGLAFGAELTLAESLPWGAEARGILAVLVGAVTALLVTRYRGGGLTSLGFRRPSRWATVPLWVLAIFAAFVAAQALVPTLIGLMFEVPQPDLSRYDSLRGNLSAALLMALLLPLAAAIPEEIVYRGFLINRLEQLFGDGPSAATMAVVCQAAIFGSVHFQWGLGGVLFATIMGAVWGTAFLLCGRNLWIVILAHSLAHLALVAQLYSLPPAA